MDRRQSEVALLLDSPTFGLPPAAAAAAYPSQTYTPHLSLEGLAQPTFGVGASSFGAAIGGGVALQFGDMLGDHILATAVQFSSIGNNFSPKDTAAEVAYINLAHRLNWGVVASQVPFLSGGYGASFGQVGNQPAEIDQTFLYRQTQQSAAGILSYPFDRARRVEFQGGVTRLSFDQIVETTAFSLYTGQLLSDNTVTSPVAPALTLGTTSGAYVFDTSNFGATSPVVGTRYRLEASPTFGSINYTGLLADYRHYFMPMPFYTIATRFLHYGRYGSGSEDPRLFPLFIGYPTLVRGYGIETFTAADCPPNSNDCPSLNRLIGSRVLVGNLELRFPLLRPFGASQRMYGPVPVEVGLFTDGGVAWNQGEKPSFLGGTRQGVSSAGLALRVNLLGFAVGEFDFSRPFQRPGQGWVFQFNLSPGF
jgi:outer membrane protein assembly factor BamA